MFFEEGICGFTAPECDELAMQGIHPWDSDAEDALAVILDRDPYRECAYDGHDFDGNGSSDGGSSFGGSDASNRGCELARNATNELRARCAADKPRNVTGTKRKRSSEPTEPDATGHHLDRSSCIDASDDVDALAYIEANHSEWVSWLDRLPPYKVQQYDLPLQSRKMRQSTKYECPECGQGFNKLKKFKAHKQRTRHNGSTKKAAIEPRAVLHDPARHSAATRILFWKESGGPPLTQVARSNKRRRLERADPRIVKMVRYDEPYMCSFFVTRGFCYHRATCSYAHGEMRLCDCESEDCPCGHPSRSRPQQCRNGPWDVCRWNSKAECRFHHGVALSCNCTSICCLKAHPARTQVHRGTVNKTCLSCGQVGHVERSGKCLRERAWQLAAERGCSRCGNVAHGVRTCEFPKKSKEARRLKTKRLAERRAQSMALKVSDNETNIYQLASKIHPGQAVRVGKPLDAGPSNASGECASEVRAGETVLAVCAGGNAKDAREKAIKSAVSVLESSKPDPTSY